MPERALPIALSGHTLVALLSGALWWPAERALIFSDLHFEKGSSYARRGMLLPPYDTRETLLRMTAEIDRLDPATVVCLGDSFHDAGAWARMHADDAALLHALAHGRRFVWIAGNHDGDLSRDLPGEIVEEWRAAALVFRHRAEAAGEGEISGHYHPKARVRAGGRTVVRPCFVADGRRLILPAFGAYTGGLEVGDPALRALFPGGFVAYVAGQTRLFRFAAGGFVPAGP